MEWQEPAIVLDARPYGEDDAVVTVFAATQGRHRGLARGGAARGGAAIWQKGNLVAARWVGRLPDQLGNLTAELVHAAAARAMEDPLTLAVLASACAVAEGALPEREAHPRVHAGLMHLIAHLDATALAAELVRWEAGLLADLGWGLDLESCAVSGSAADLAYVSPRTGRAVSRAAAGDWAKRLLVLPGFLLGSSESGPADWADGLRLTGHFLARDAFGQRHRPLPASRVRLYDRVVAMAADSKDG